MKRKQKRKQKKKSEMCEQPRRRRKKIINENFMSTTTQKGNVLLGKMNLDERKPIVTSLLIYCRKSEGEKCFSQFFLSMYNLMFAFFDKRQQCLAAILKSMFNENGPIIKLCYLIKYY